MPSAIVSVTNDLTTDQRVDRTCQTLVKLGYDVLLVGRRLRNSKQLAPRSYRTHRMRLLFDKGPLFYAEYNIALFFYLLTHSSDMLVSNDLDTLPANYLANLIKHPFSGAGQTSQISHLHDCHEYFRGVPELAGRNSVTKIWKWIEDRIFPRIKYVTAVNKSVAELYHNEYGNRIVILRNVPFRKQLAGAVDKKVLNIRANQKIILYQGALNVDRGLEEAILAMKYLKTDAVMVIIGIGDVSESLKTLAETEGISEKVRFPGQIPFQHLHGYTQIADLGLSVEKDVSVNYHFCLPNKFLDYIQANIPVLVSPFPEMKSLVERYQIGEFLEDHDPVTLALQLDKLLNDEVKLFGFKLNLLKAAEELCWENEELGLINLLNNRIIEH